jgi:hypothetical protein
LAAYSLHACRDARETTQAARDAFLRRFEDQVDPDRTLPADERQRRATAALKAHMTRLSYRSARSRRLAKEESLAADIEDGPADNGAVDNPITADLPDRGDRHG